MKVENKPYVLKEGITVKPYRGVYSHPGQAETKTGWLLIEGAEENRVIYLHLDRKTLEFLKDLTDGEWEEKEGG